MSPLDAAGSVRSPAILRSADPAGTQVKRRATRTRCYAVGPLNGRFRALGLFGGMARKGEREHNLVVGLFLKMLASSMRWAFLPLATLMLCGQVSAHELRAPPTLADANAALAAHQNDLCRSLIDVCEGVPNETVEKLSCTVKNPQSATCRFKASGRACRARFSKPNPNEPHWIVSFRNRTPNVRCR